MQATDLVNPTIEPSAANGLAPSSAAGAGVGVSATAPTAQSQADLQRLAMLGELLGTTTHEFNNVLMTIISFAKLGLRNSDSAARDNAFQRILTAGERAAKISATILNVAKNRAGELECVSLASLVDDVLVLMERELNKYRVRLDLKHEETPVVSVSRSQLQQVILNLIVNARQAMPHGGELRIRTQPSGDGQWVELIIRDTGHGIPQDRLRRIFDPYYSTKSGPDETGRGGTGLGLTACRDIIRNHGGRLRVESTVGKGTAFIIRLPAAVAR
jgi:signal transduction histidine kinase